MSKRKKLIVNICMSLLLALLTVAGALVYFNYYPRVTVYFIDEFQILNSVELKRGNALPNLPKPVKVGSRFLGWYTDADYKTMYNPRTVVKNNLELFAKFEKIEYHLQYRISSHGYNTKIYDEMTAYYADAISIPTGEEQITIGGATRSLNTLVPGYDFVGWTLSADGTGDVYNASTGFSMLANDAVLYAKWTPKKFEYQFFNVLYNTPHPSSYDYPTLQHYTSLVYMYGELAFAPEVAPQVAHNTFEGWYYDQSLNNPVDWSKAKLGADGQLEVEGHEVSSTQLIFGKFKMNEYTMSYDLNAPVGATVLVAGNADIADRSIYYGMTVTRVSKGLGLSAVSSSDNSKELYKFMGWNTKPDGTGDNIYGDFIVSADEDITLYAMWERYYYLSFIDEGKVLDHYNYKLIVGEHYTLPTVIKQPNFNDDVVKTGYYFEGWSLTNNGEVVDFEYVLDNPRDITFFAVWQRNKYTVHIGLDGGIANPEIDLSDIVTLYGSNVPLPNFTTSVTKAGYQMRGWKVLGKNGLEDKTLKITGIGTNETFALNSQNIAYATQVNGVWVIDVVPNFIEEITIEYDLNGGEGKANSDTKLLGQSFHLHSGEDITKQYYQLQGWSTTDTGDVEYALKADATFTADTTLYAVWKAVEYKVQVLDKGHTGNNTNRLQPLTLDVENPLQLVIDADRLGITVHEGYSLIGLTADAKNINVSAEYVAENSPYTITVEDFAKGTTLILYTVITRNQYTVQWMVNDEPYGETQTVSHGGALTHPAEPHVTGYIFQYWALVGDKPEPIPNNYMVTCDMQLQAIFEKDVITLSFVYLSPYGDRDNALNSMHDYKYHDVVTQQQINDFTAKLPTITGYQFDAWYATQTPTASSVALSAGQVVTRTLTYYSHYNAVDVSLIFRTNEGTGADYVIDTKYDATITLPNATITNFECTGKVLAGWKLNDGTHVGDVGSQYTIKWDTDTILVTEWKDVNTYQVTFTYDNDDITTPIVQTFNVNHGETIVAPAGQDTTNYRFQHYTDASGAVVQAGDTIGPVTQTMQYTAVYVSLPTANYTLNISTNDATRGVIRDSLNNTGANFVAYVQYSDIISISGNVVTLTKQGESASYATYTAIPADESWEFSGIDMIVDGVRTHVDSTYVVGDMSGSTWAMEFVFIAGHLTIDYTVKADYAGSAVTPVQVQFTVVNDGTDTAWLDLGALGSHITTNYTLSATHDMTFKIVVPRNSTSTYITMRAIAGTGYGITSMGGETLDYVSSHSTQYSGITSSASYTLGVKLRQCNVTISSNNYAYGTVGYSYSLNKVVDGYIVAETDKTYNASGASSAYTLTLPYGTRLTLTATALAGHGFSKWSVGDYTDNNATTTLNVMDSASYVAEFNNNTYTYKFVLKSGTNELVIDTLTDIKAGDDITTRVEGALTPTNEQMTSIGLDNKWFDKWSIDSLYTDGNIIAGTRDVTIYAELSDATIVTINSVNCSAVADKNVIGDWIYLEGGVERYKIKIGTAFPNIENIAIDFGCHFVSITDNNGNMLSPSDTLIGYIVPAGLTTINVNCAIDEYTINFVCSDGVTVWKSYTAHFDQKYLSLIDGLEMPPYLSIDPTKQYTFTGWQLSADSDILTSDRVIGDHENGAVITVYPTYTIQQKYRVRIYNQDTPVYDEYLLSGEQVALDDYTVSGKQLLYLSPNADDDGCATSSDVANLYAINYLWVNGTPGYRIAYSGDHKTTLTVGGSDIQFYAIYADIVNIRFQMEYDGEIIATNNYVVGSVINLNYYTDLANAKLAPHYQVRQIYNVPSTWNFAQFIDMGTTSSDALTNNNCCNPDAQFVINRSLILSFTSRQLSKNVYIYSDDTKSAYRVGVVGAGDVINTAISTGYGGDNYNVLPYYWENNTWNSVPSLDTNVWNMPGYTFVGYIVEGTTTLYNNANIDSLVMGSSNMVLICKYQVNNYNLQLLGDIPSYSSEHQAHIAVTYTSRMAGADNEVGTLTTSTLDINHDSNRDISVAYGTDITIEVFTALGVSYKGLTYTGEFLTPPNTTSTTFTCSVTQDSGITFNFEVVQLQITLSETRNGSYLGDSSDKVGRWLLDDSEVPGNTLSVPFGSSFDNSGTISYYNWHGDPVEHTLRYQVFDGKYYKLANYSVDGAVLSDGHEFAQDKNYTLSAGISRTYNVSFSADGATNVPSSQVVTCDENIVLSAPSRTGYTFLGWTTTLTDGTVITTTPLQTSVKLGANDNSKYDIAFTAMWQGNPVMIGFGAVGDTQTTYWSKATYDAEYGDQVTVQYTDGTLSVVIGGSVINFFHDDTKSQLIGFKVGSTTYTSTTTFTLSGDTNISAVLEMIPTV